MTIEASNSGGVEWDRGNPARRCTATSNRTGKRCRKWAIRGGTVCATHGGSTGHIKAKARQRLEEAADRMALALLGIAGSAASEAVKLAAIKDALDRAGLRPPAQVEVSVDPAPWEELMGDVMQITRAQHMAIYHPDQAAPAAALPPADDGLDVMDAELVPPQEPHKNGPRAP